MKENMQYESLGMRLFKFLGMNKVSWSLRRLHCPVDAKSLVLEVGAGGNPYFRSNVLVDAYEATAERHWAPLITDRPTVLAFAEKLPFKDKQFDFVIASHVFEHSSDPVAFLREIERVAKAGYIEVPDAFMERVNPYPDHRLEITIRNDKLRISKKESSTVDPFLVELYEDRAKDIIAKKVIPKYPYDFHVRYYWKDKIEYEITNPKAIVHDYSVESFDSQKLRKRSARAIIQDLLLRIVRRLFSQHGRNSKIDLLTLIQCTSCQYSPLSRDENILTCNKCGSKFVVKNDVPDMTMSSVI